jgi:hypothetical protein
MMTRLRDQLNDIPTVRQLPTHAVVREAAFYPAIGSEPIPAPQEIAEAPPLDCETAQAAICEHGINAHGNPRDKGYFSEAFDILGRVGVKADEM